MQAVRGHRAVVRHVLSGSRISFSHGELGAAAPDDLLRLRIGGLG
jgi:hypothetical protein